MTTTNYGKVRPPHLLPPALCSSRGLMRAAVRGWTAPEVARTQVLCPVVSLPWSSADTGEGAVWAGPWASAHLHGILPWQAWAAGDIVSCLIDLDEGTLSFSL